MASERSFEEGASFILVNLPKGSQFGIDCHSWIVGDNFRGVKRIPPGWHVISCSSANKSGDTSVSMVSFFHNFSAREIFVKKWNIQLEEFDKTVVSDEDVERFRANKAEVDCYLGLYPLDEFRKWLSLSNFIDSDVIGMLMPACGCIFSATQFISEKQTFSKSQRYQHPINDTAPGDIAQAEARLPKQLEDADAAIHYSVINRRSFEVGSSPSSISVNSMDGSHHLEALFQNRFNGNCRLFLGETQFAFLSFLICQNYDSFEQWKKIVELICSCDNALTKYPQFFLDFLKIFYFQLKEVPSDFFVDIVSADNFLTVTLHRFFSNVKSSDVPANLKNRVEKFHKYVTDHFKWDFTTELAEEEPVIVDM